MELSPALRAGLDQEVTATLDQLRVQAADYDGQDLPDAVIAFAARLLQEATEEELADVAALLALTMHRQAAAATCTCLGASWPHVPSSKRCEPSTVACVVKTPHRAHRWVQMPGQWRECQGVEASKVN